MPSRFNLVLAVVVIMLGFGILTPNGLVIIVENPAVRYVVGLALIGLGAVAAFNQRARARA